MNTWALLEIIVKYFFADSLSTGSRLTKANINPNHHHLDPDTKFTPRNKHQASVCQIRDSLMNELQSWSWQTVTKIDQQPLKTKVALILHLLYSRKKLWKSLKWKWLFVSVTRPCFGSVQTLTEVTVAGTCHSNLLQRL